MEAAKETKFDTNASYPDWCISPHADCQSLQNTNSLQHWPSPTMQWPVSLTTTVRGGPASLSH